MTSWFKVLGIMYHKQTFWKREKNSIVVEIIHGSLWIIQTNLNKIIFPKFSCMFLNPNYFWIVLIHQIWETFRNKLKKHSVSNIVLTFHSLNYSNDHKNFANLRPSSSNFKSCSRSLEQLCLTVGQNNFGNKMPFISLKIALSFNLLNFSIMVEKFTNVCL